MAIDGLFSEILDLREEIEAMRREVEALKRGVLGELERVRQALT